MWACEHVWVVLVPADLSLFLEVWLFIFQLVQVALQVLHATQC